MKTAVNEVITKFKIPKCRIINMDESPYFWEYLPRRILAPKLSGVATCWKRGYHNCRSTLTLAIAADGTFLRLLLILQRKTPYSLKCSNEIYMIVSNTKNGWANEETIIEWINKILLPYVNGEHCMLLWDSYEAHKSFNVLEHLKKTPHVHVGIIIGGRTSVDQPLDISVNKTICKRESISHANILLNYLTESNSSTQNDHNKKEKLIRGKSVIFIMRIIS